MLWVHRRVPLEEKTSGEGSPELGVEEGLGPMEGGHPRLREQHTTRGMGKPRPWCSGVSIVSGDVLKPMIKRVAFMLMVVGSCCRFQ